MNEPRRLRAPGQNGAVLAGPKPTEDPSLGDDQAEFVGLASELFGDGSVNFANPRWMKYTGLSLTDGLGGERQKYVKI